MNDRYGKPYGVNLLNDAREAACRLKRIEKGTELSDLTLDDQQKIIAAFIKLDDDRVVENLGQLVQRLARMVNRTYAPESHEYVAATKAIDYCKRMGLLGTILREAGQCETSERGTLVRKPTQ